MRLFAIGDLHLPGGQDKPMDVFGGHWDGHFDKIASDWLEKVEPQDVVLLPGDLSWAMTFDEAMLDLSRIYALPGKKVLLRGNHDYWWPAISRFRKSLPDGAYVLQNDAADLEKWVIAGSRGWNIPRGSNPDPQDQKIYLREIQRLELSLLDAQKKAQGREIIGMMHYPPMNETQEDSGFTQLFERFQVKSVVYGHLHAEGLKMAFNGLKNGVSYSNVSCDGLSFALKQIK